MSYGFIVPNYNHTSRIEQILTKLLSYGWPVIMVDDHSEPLAQKLFEQLDRENSLLTVIRHSTNMGKGGAVQTGLQAAYEQGIEHAIQIDADGQHNLDDIDKLISASRQYPLHVISGKPVYDDSIPKHRFIARYITHFWVIIETLSLVLKDTMCGFRVYPVAACISLMEQQSLGNRMDFDIEILVRLYWRKVPTNFIDTHVQYPEDGVSHFKLWQDNLRISWMHTRLVFGMIIRLPVLLARKWG